MCKYRSFKTILICFLVATIVAIYVMASIGQAQELKAENQMNKDEVWAQIESSKFIRTWLLCGVFPNPPHEGEQVYDHTPPCIGLETDYLTAHGGETKISPAAGMIHKRPDGTEAQWFEYISPNDIVDFNSAFKGQFVNVVAYAYTTIKSEAAGKAILALGSDDGVRVWLNGKLTHDHLVGRGVSKDEDLVTVTLQTGDNPLLIKVEQGSGDWGFVLRIIGKTEALALEAQKKLREFQNCELRPKGRWDYMFTPGNFPEIVWDKPQTVEQSMGSFPIKVRWFNDKLEEVTKADKPGRYLAYVEGQSLSGVKIRRAQTLYCRPADWQPWNDNIKAYVDYFPKSHINQEAWNERKEMIASRAGSLFVDSLETEEYGAILMSYFHEMKPIGREPLPTDTPEIIHDDLHLALKRKLLGIEDKYPPLQLPRKSNTQAPVLRNGTAKEAVVKEDAAEKIRAVCREWYEESKEPFVILVARRGVIIIHEVFDETSGGSVKIDTAFQMASITKAITGMMFAQFIDQGIIDLDDPVGKYLPDFPVEGDKVITLRHCFTHTTGLEGHYEWGGMHNPWLDNVILNGIDYLSPGKIHKYNGMGYDLAGKVMEVVSGKSIFRLMHENFFEPLGVSKTTIDDLATATTSSAEDIARMGQLLLNKGSYGDRIFFSPETFEKLLPKQLNKYYPSVDVEWGIGLTWMRANDPDAGKSGVPEDKTLLSKNTIGHGAASSAILRVDLDNEIVVSQVRNTAGPKYQEYLIKFLKAIDDSILKE
jgi:CubicO group peptidase (beta-lactamase class C family)